MKLLTEPDGNVFKTVGEGRLPAQGSALRPSLYAVAYTIGGRSFVFNTLTRQVLDAGELFGLFADRLQIAFDEKNEDIAALVRQRFLVPLDASEVKTYLGAVAVLRLLDKKLAPGHKAYVILPTTACNARCFYCYESGMEAKSMSRKTADDVVEYIKSSKSEGGISIRWFGGEPLMGETAIDRICEGLERSGVEFRSDIITNASLLDPQLALKMREKWKVEHAQVTLDGRRTEYLRRKAYVPGFEGAWERVIAGIHLLAENKIRVNIRLNADNDNIDELFLLADELEREFGEEKLVSVYASQLYSGCGSIVRDADAMLHSRITELSEELCSLGLAHGGNFGRLRTWRCMADVPNGAAVIAPDGTLYCCEHMIPQSEIGSIYDRGSEWEHRKRFIRDNSRAEKRRECLECPFMPECTDNCHCPVEGADCALSVKEQLGRKLMRLLQRPINSIKTE